MQEYSREISEVPNTTGQTTVNLPDMGGGGTWEIVLVAAGATLVTQFLRPLLDLVIEQFQTDAKASVKLHEVLEGKLDTMGEERRVQVAEMKQTCTALQEQQREILDLLRKLV